MFAGWSRDFRALMAAFAVSSIGTKVAREAVPLTAVLVLQAGPGALSLLGIAATLPVLVLGLFAGVWGGSPAAPAADDRRRSAAFSRAVSIPIAAWCNLLTLTQLLAVVVAVAALSLLFLAADTAYLPALVEADRLAPANAARETIDASAEIIGPPIGGVLVQVLTAPGGIVDRRDLLSGVGPLPAPDEARRSRSCRRRAERPRILQQIAEGLRTLWHQPILRRCCSPGRSAPSSAA